MFACVRAVWYGVVCVRDCVFTYLFSDLAGHLFSKVPVLTDSVEQLTTLHHLHNNQEPRSVKKTRKEVLMVKGNSDTEERRKEMDLKQINSHRHKNSLPWARLVWELDTVGVNLQDLHYVWVVGAHHMETHLHGRQSNSLFSDFQKQRMVLFAKNVFNACFLCIIIQFIS